MNRRCKGARRRKWTKARKVVERDQGKDKDTEEEAKKKRGK